MRAHRAALPKQVVLQLPAQARYLDTIRLALYGVAVQQQFTYEAIEDLKVAVTEACNHALLQMLDTEETELRIVFQLEEAGLRVRVRAEKQGITYDEAVASVRLGSFGEALHPDDYADRQIGLYLMQALVDQVEVATDGDGLQEITLTKNKA